MGSTRSISGARLTSGLAVGVIVALAAAFAPNAASGTPVAAERQGRHAQPKPDVSSRSDAANNKLDAPLQRLVARHDAERVAVVVTVRGSTTAVEQQLSADHTAKAKDAGMVVGSIAANRLLKLAVDKNVVGV